MCKCKKASDSEKPCQTKPDDQKTSFAAVRIADASGSMDNVLVRDDALFTLAGVDKIEDLSALIDRSGTQGMCFQSRFDVRIGANSAKKPRPGCVVTEPECSFQILWARAQNFAPWDTPERPAVGKVLSVSGDPHSGQVLPIRSISQDLEETPTGVKFRHAEFSPEFVSLLCVCTEDPETEEAIVDEVKFVQLTHTRVLPLLKPGETLSEPFVAEAICPLKRAASFSIADGQPRMLVGSVTFVANKPKLAVAQAIRLMHPETECKFFSRRA